MRKIKLGRREFEMMPLGVETVCLLKTKSETLGDDIGIDENGKSDIGDVVLFVLIACFGNEHNAIQVGEMLAETEMGNITMDQATEALAIVRGAIGEWK